MARRPARRLLVVPQRRQALERIVLHATNLRIPIVEVEGGSLTALAGFDGHQGVALVVEPRRFATIDDVLARAAERGEPPLILVLDSLEDPHNVGSLLRSAEGAGVHGVLFPVKRQAPLTPSAIKASAGAVEHLLMVPVDDLASALVDLHSHGVWVAGADGDAPLTARQTDLRGPIAIVVGSEGQGLGPAVRKRCDLFVRIPLRGAIGSLNAAVAGSVLLFEVAAQRDPDGTASRPAARNVQAGPFVVPAVEQAPEPASESEPEIEVAAPGPAEAAAPDAPAKTAKRARATKATTDAEPTKPTKPARTKKPAVTSKATEPEPTKAAKSAKPAKTAKKVARVAPEAEPATAAKPAKAAKAKPVKAKPPKTVKPATTTNVAKGAEPPAARAGRATKATRTTAPAAVDDDDDALLP